MLFLASFTNSYCETLSSARKLQRAKHEGLSLPEDNVNVDLSSYMKLLWDSDLLCKRK